MKQAALLLDLAGLSHQEGANFLQVRLDTVQSWRRKNKPTEARPGVIAELKALVEKQERAAAQAITQIEALVAQNGAPDCIEIGYPADDYEAQELGFPCVGAWRAMAARILLNAPAPIIFVPRGSTVGTAAAADAHGK